MPMPEVLLAVLSFCSVVASVQTGHWFATPFAALFTIGYTYVAILVVTEQTARRQQQALLGRTSERPSAEPMALADDRDELPAA
jgi:hypothetical protein